MRRIFTDVAIVGGGPAGSAVAALLSLAGIEAIVLEKDSFPRDKLCGEFLSWDAEAVLQILSLDEELTRVGARPISRCSIHARDCVVEFDLPGVARGVSRASLDHLIARRAAALGASLLERTIVTRIEPSSPRPFLLARSKDEELTIEARLIVGAWGRWGRLDQQLQRRWTRNRSRRYFGFKRHYRGADLAERIEIHSFGRGYLGVSPVEGEMVNVCGLVHEERIRGMRDRWESFVDSLDAEAPRFGDLSSYLTPVDPAFLSSEPVIFRARDAQRDGTLMVGDTAGIVDPLAGNGMAMALQSSLLAAIHIRKGLANRTTLERRVLSDYDAEFRKLFAPRIRWSRSVAFLLERPDLLRAFIGAPTPAWLPSLLASKTRGRPEEIERLADRFLSD